MRRMAVTSVTIGMIGVGVVTVLVAAGCRSADRDETATGPTRPPTSRVSTSRVSTSRVSTSRVPTTRVPTTVTAVPTGASTTGMSTSTTSPEAAALAGLAAIETGVHECFRLPSVCDVTALAAVGSPALDYLAGLRDYYVDNDLVARLIPELRYVVPEHVDLIGADRALVTLCEVDGSWQMVAHGTLDTADDTVWNDALESRRATHELVRTGGRWRRFETVELELWIGENRCPAKPSS